MSYSIYFNMLSLCLLVADRIFIIFCLIQTAGWKRSDVRTAFCSAFIAGFFMTCTVSPFDRIRTNLMNQPTDKKIYDGFVDCVVKTVKADGPLSLWRGFVPMYVANSHRRFHFSVDELIRFSLTRFNWCYHYTSPVYQHLPYFPLYCRTRKE